VLAQEGVEFSIQTDSRRVGLEDVFEVTVTAAGAPADAQILLPGSPDVDIVNTRSGTHRSISMGSGAGPSIRTVRTVSLQMRAKRTGTIRLTPAVLALGDREWKTEALQIEVVRGSVPGRRRPSQQDQDPFAGLFPPGLLDQLNDFPVPRPRDAPAGPDMPGVHIPQREADVFMRTLVDSNRVTVGQQVTMSVWVFSRAEISAADAFTLPKAEGFLTEEVDAPTQLASQQRTIDGVPYRAYLLRRRALFPVKAGELTIGPASADIVTGYLYAGEKRHRKSRPVTITVDPLPPGAPPGMAPMQVGQWSVALEASRTVVELDQPFNVKVTLKGRGNVRGQTVPKLELKGDAFRVFEPKVEDQVDTPRGRVQGSRVAEYLVIPKRTGTFTLPSLSYPYFDPETRQYEVARSDPVQITVVPGRGGGSPVAQDSTQLEEPRDDAAARNVLGQQQGPRPIRVTARFESPSPPIYGRRWFWPAVFSPVMLLGLLAFIQGPGRSLLGGRKGDERRTLTRAAHRRLSAAVKLKDSGSQQAFLGEVEKAVLAFLTAQLGSPAQGLTQQALEEKLAAAGIAEPTRARVHRVLETCAMGRYAPGSGSAAAREQVLQEASALMDGWSRS